MQIIVWACTVVPIILLVSRMGSTGKSLIDTQKDDFDFFLLVTAILQMLIRSAVIGAKYATYPEKLFSKIHQTVLTKQENDSEHLAQAEGQFRTTPDGVLNDVA